MGEDDEVRGLAEVSGFAAHVGAGDEKQVGRRGVVAGVKIEVVGDEAGFTGVVHEALDNGVAASDDFEEGCGVDAGAGVAAKRGEMREVGDEVDFGDGGAGAPDAAGVIDEATAEVGEDAFFDFDGALLGGEDFGFVVLELRGGKALGVDEGLLAFVVGRDAGEVGFGDFDVVAEDGIKADLEGADAGAAALAVFDGGDGGSTR